MNIRPTSLHEVAVESDSIEDFGHHLRDWLHELRNASSRRQAALAIADEPPRLREKFPQGAVADAWLGAYAETLAGRLGVPTPAWAFAPWRTSDDPVFDDGSTPTLRTLALIRAPLAFKRRNIFTPSVDLPLNLRAGRPKKSAAEKRLTNAERQRRFRERRRAELAHLRTLSEKVSSWRHR